MTGRGRLFLECTTTYEYGGNTGIQRVVRNVIGHCRSVGPRLGIDCQPVVWNARAAAFVPVDGVRREPPCAGVPDEQPRGLLAAGKRLVSRLPSPIRKALGQQHLRQVLKGGVRCAERVAGLLRGHGEDASLRFRPGDMLFLLDSTWHIPLWREVHQAKRSGACVGSALYDLVPVVAPETCDDALVRCFRTWLDRAMECTDFFVCISRAVAAEAAEFLGRRYPRVAGGEVSFDYAHLGTDLDLAGERPQVRDELRTIFETPGARKPYVCVSTLEPRKNHAYLLDAFDLAWAQGVDCSLVLVGKKGWKCEDLLGRLERHPLRGRRLWVFHDLNDDELACCYRGARATISSSRIEGFGLPVVEALSRGCPAWLSDIPVYREVGGDFCLYFPLASPHALAGLLAANDRPGGVRAPRPAAEFSWPNWEASTEGLLGRILELAARVRSRTLGHEEGRIR